MTGDGAGMTTTGGPLLKRLRQEHGLELEVLASMIKVAPSKLSALEAGRYDALPDAVFTRALAMAVCRALKVDAASVLAGLPHAQPVSLASSEPNAVPFKARRARLNLDVPTTVPWRELISARWLVPAGVLLAAAVVYFLPQDVHWPGAVGSQGASLAQAPSGAASQALSEVPEATVAPVEVSAASVPDQAASSELSAAPGGLDRTLERAPAASGGDQVVAPTADGASAVAGAPVTATGTALVLNVSESSWIEVRDAQGEKLLSRHVMAGEMLGIDGMPPLSVKIGNVSGVAMVYKGHSVDMSAFTRANVARMELK
jgi:cytoskeleton protein RodZ